MPGNGTTFEENYLDILGCSCSLCFCWLASLTRNQSFSGTRAFPSSRGCPPSPSFFQKLRPLSKLGFFINLLLKGSSFCPELHFMVPARQQLGPDLEQGLTFTAPGAGPAAPAVFAFVGLLLEYETKASLGPGPLPAAEAALRAQAFPKTQASQKARLSC